MPHKIVILQGWQVSAYEGLDVRKNVFCSSAKKQSHWLAALFLFHPVHARFLDIESKPLRNRQLIIGIKHRNVALGIPVTNVTIVVAFNTILIFDDCSHFHLRHAEFHDHLVLVETLFAGHRALHLRLHQLAVFHVVGSSLQSRHNLMARTIGLVFQIKNLAISQSLAFWFQYLQTSIHTIKHLEVVVDKLIAHIC